MSTSISTARWHLRVILTALIIVCLVASFSPAADGTSSKAQTMRQTGKQILEVGYEQYRRGMYGDAKATLDKASAYREYLSISDASKLDELLAKLGSQPSPPVNQPASQSTAAELLSQARSFAAQGQYDQAKEKYLQAEQSGLLSNEELASVEAELKAIEQAQAAQQKPAVVEQKTEPVVVEQPVQSQQPNVDSQYIEFIPVNENDTNQAIITPIPVQPQVNPEFVTPTPQDEVNYVIIDENTIKQQPIQPPTAPAVQAEKENYIEVVKQKQRIQQSYTKAVVNEAIAKAKEYADKQDFAKAKDEILRASSVVEKNKLLLGDQDYTQYTAILKQLLGEINTRQLEIEGQKTEKAKAEAQVSQEKLRAQQAADKNSRIQNLLAHSAEYQEQQRYDEALAEIETLLAIDPINREALRSRQMLEDIINLRTQLEVKREIGKQEEAVLTDTQRSMIPHADLITYPRNWQDIAAKRKPNVITGLSTVDVVVYKQLDTLVDLTALTPDTPLSEAIEIIKNSVDPPLKIVVRWKDLADNAYIEPDTVIGMQGLSGIPVGKALKELLNTVSGGIANIDYAVEDGIITIATKTSLPGKLVTHVYDITELVGRPAQFQTDLTVGTSISGGGGGGQTVAGGTGGETVVQDATTVIQMIQETITPESWLINGGEGTISAHGNRLVISQIPQIHEQIQKLLLEDLRESLGQQVSIETRFLFVTENFLEDIGLGVSQITVPSGKLFGAPYSFMDFRFGSSDNTAPTKTTVAGSLAENIVSPAVQLFEDVQYGGPVLDDLAVSFFLRAVQSHRDAKILTAPRVTVLSGESAYIRVVKETSYVSDYEFEDITAAGAEQPTRVIATATTDVIAGGVVLNVTPTISADKKYITLLIGTNYTKTDFTSYNVYATGTERAFPISLPTLEVSEIQTRVNVPDGGTLLIGGQKLGAEVNMESGVPGLSKVPIVGRLFSARSKVKDQDVLLVLVKPTIILQHEAEREAFAPLED